MSYTADAVPPAPPSQPPSPVVAARDKTDSLATTTDPEPPRASEGKVAKSSLAADLAKGADGAVPQGSFPDMVMTDPSAPSEPAPPPAAPKPRLGLIATAKRQVTGATAVTFDAIGSGAWAYPIYGVVYLTTHPNLIIPVLPLLLRALLMSAGVVAACFFFLYLPQVAWLAIFTGPLAFGAAVPLVLAEAGVILLFFSKSFLLGPLGTDLFDAVLVQKGHESLVKKQRPITTDKNNTKRLSRLLKAPFAKLSTDNLVRMLLTLPFNYVPVVGTAFFVGYNGYKTGPSYHARYFQLKAFDKQRREAFIERRRGAYTAFGTMTMIFNLVPVVNIILGLASHVGAALWAAKIESKDGARQEVADVVLPPRMYSIVRHVFPSEYRVVKAEVK